MYLLDVSIRDLKYFCVLFVLFVFLFMLLALLRCYTSIFDGFIINNVLVFSNKVESEHSNLPLEIFATSLLSLERQ